MRLDAICQPSRPTPVTRATAAQKKLAKHTRPLGRMRSSSRLLALQSVDDAKRVSVKKEHAHATKKQKPGDGYSYVYVGNVSVSLSLCLTNPHPYQQIDPIISTKDLEAFFKPCGPVACIQVRCSRGQAITRNMPVPSNVRTSRDRQYATVEFSDSKAVQKAILKNGSRLKGCRLVVCVQLYRSFELLIIPAQVSVSAADLPEVKDILRR